MTDAVPERMKISSRDIADLRALGYMDTRISTMDLDEVDLILFNRIQATDRSKGYD